MNILSDLAEKECGTQKKSQRQEKVAGVEDSWKSYTCFSADQLKRKEDGKLDDLTQRSMAGYGL